MYRRRKLTLSNLVPTPLRRTSSETIRIVICISQLLLRIPEDQWILLVRTIGRIQDIQYLEVYCTPGSRDFQPLQAVADAVNNAHSLCILKVVTTFESFPRKPFGLITLANALRKHTALQEFTWRDYASRRAPRDLSLDPVLLALPACLHLRKVVIVTKCASADAMKNLLQLKSATVLHLVLEKEHLLAVADEIQRGRYNVQRWTLALVTNPISMVNKAMAEATEVVKAVASAIRLDQNLEYLDLVMGLSDEAGVALAEALMVNTTLCKIDLNGCEATLGVPAYEALSAMLRINTSLVLNLTPYETADADERLRESRLQMRIEQRLNQVGRGRLLASRQTTKEEYVDALNNLNSNSEHICPAFQVGCLYSLLCLNPSIV
jgi:hypothetical protein